MKKLINYLIDNNIRFAGSNNTVRILRATPDQEKEIRSIIDKEKLYLNLNGMITTIDLTKIPTKKSK